MRQLLLTGLVSLMVLTVSPNVEAAKKTYGTLTVKEVTSIYDGDTFRATIAGLHPIIGERIPIRIKGIDTPEMDDKRPEVRKKARQAKQFTVQKLRSAKGIELRDIERGKYFRIVADVYVDGRNLGAELVQSGMARQD